MGRPERGRAPPADRYALGERFPALAAAWSAIRSAADRQKPWVAWLKNLVPEKAAQGVEASEAVSRQHVQPSRRLSMILIAAATVLSVLVYACTIRSLYKALEIDIGEANTVLTVLSEGELQPFNPLPTEASKRSSAFRDGTQATDQNIFDYLKALGAIDPRVATYQQISVEPAAGAPSHNVVAHKLTTLGKKCSSQQGTLAQLSTVDWVVCLALERKYSVAPVCKRGEITPACKPTEKFEVGVKRALAAMPGKASALAAAVVDVDGACSASANPKCNALWDAIDNSPWWWSFLTFNPEKGPSINDITRTLLIGTGVIPRLSVEVKPGSSGRAAVDVATDAAVEKLIRLSLARVLTDPDVKSSLSWLAGLRGLEQFLMLWVLLVLLSLLAARAASRRILATEVRQTTEWFRAKIQSIIGSSPPKEGNARWQTQMQRQIGDLQRTIEQKIGNETRFIDLDQAKIRSDSLALFMLNKAVRRMLLADPEPELFRGYCQDQRELVEDSAWFLRYLARALPALGFIGTVHGIMIALGDADVIVRASNPDQMAAAMSSLTTPLSLAFATTFIALVFGLITSYATDLELAKERILLATLEAELIECVDPAERYSSAPMEKQ